MLLADYTYSLIVFLETRNRIKRIIKRHFFFFLSRQGCVFFADKEALRGSLVSTWQEVRPTLVLGVPRVWEKIMEAVQIKGRETTGG